MADTRRVKPGDAGYTPPGPDAPKWDENGVRNLDLSPAQIVRCRVCGRSWVDEEERVIARASAHQCEGWLLKLWRKLARR